MLGSGQKTTASIHPKKFRILCECERMCLALLMIAIGALAVLIISSKTEIIWKQFIYSSSLSFALMLIGIALRSKQIMPALTLCIIATSIFGIYTNVLAINLYLMFPLPRPLIDEELAYVDSILGVDWVSAVKFIAEFPDFAYFLRLVYSSTIFQIMITFATLSILLKVVNLYQMLSTFMIAGFWMFGFWAYWPSIGPSAFHELPPEIIATSRLLVTPEYGASLLDLAQNGTSRIERHMLLGTVAFPSFHIFLAMLVVWFSYRTILFWPILVLNIFMIPATFIHGGHYFVDLIGGAVLFAISLYSVNSIFKVAADFRRSSS